MDEFNEEVSMNGKGDSPRPLSVDADTFASNWDRIFNAPEQKKTPSVIEAEKFNYLTELHSGMFFEWYPSLTGKWEEDKTRWFLAKQMRNHINTGEK
jgi:hypothetical protein